MRRAGFTLAETVVALSLFATAVVALNQAAINARYGLMRLDESDPWRARVNEIREELLGIMDRKTLEQGGETELAQHVRKNGQDAGEDPDQTSAPIRARWEVEITPTRILDVHQFSFEVTFDQGSEMSAVHVGSCYVYRPNWYETNERDALLTDKRDEWERRRQERQP